MATRTISASLTSPTSATLIDGDYIYYSSSTSHSGVVSNGTVNSAYVTFTNFRVYSGSCYMSIYVGGTKVGETIEMDGEDYGNGSTTTVEVEMEALKAALLTATGEIEIHCYNNNSSTGDTYGVRNSGTCTITVNYTAPSLSAPGTPSITQNNDGTFTATWTKSTLSGASGTVYYGLWSVDDGGLVQGGITGTSVTRSIGVYSSSRTYKIVAYYGSSDYWSVSVESWSSSASKTFYPPSISTPTLTLGSTSGSSVSLSWTAASLSYTGGSISYGVYINNTLFKTQTTRTLTIAESDLANQTSPMTIKVTATASSLTNTYSGTSLSKTSSGKTFIYVPSTTACTAPTSVTVASNNVAPGASITLSWSGASAGTNNAISGYEIYRATSATGTYSKLTTVTSSATSGSTSVTAPTTNGSSYYYKVLTVGSVSGYSSEQSTVYATLTCTYTAPTAPTTITIGGSSSAYAASGANVTLAWSGASAGTNNAITGYLIYRDGVSYTTTTSTSISVPAHATAGSKYTYTVYTKGAHSNSGASAGRNVYTYGNPTAPTAISVTNSTPDAGVGVTLVWSGAAAGSYNSISGYLIYRATSASGSYSKLTEIESTSTSGSCTVTAPSTMGSSYYYKVYTKGARSNSAISSVYATVTAKTYTSCSAPTTLSFAKTVSDGEPVTLSWTGASGGTNNSITQYTVYVRESSDGLSWGDWQQYLIVGSTSTSDACSVNPPSTYGNYYQASVIVNGSAGEDYYSGREISTNTLRRNHAPLSSFTDEELISGTTHVKAVHMTELHDRINSLLEYYGLSKVTFSSIVSNSTDLKDWTKHVTEIRNAIDLISTNHSDWYSITVNRPTASVIQQIRDIILTL